MTSLILPGNEIDKSVIFTPIGLEISRELPFDSWLKLGNQLRYMEGAIHWWIGDFLNYGEQKWGQMYSQFYDYESGDGWYEYKTLRNDKYTASQINLSRRRDKLSWSHHAEVAGLEPDDQEYWLDIAEQENLNRDDFRRRIKRGRPLFDPDDMTPDDIDEESYQLPANIVKLHTGNFAVVANEIEDSSVDAIITDPPYSFEFLSLYEQLAIQAKRLLKPGGSLLVMCGQFYLPKVFDLLEAHLQYHWVDAYLTPGGQAPQIWQRKINTFWKPVLWFTNGEYNGKWIGDVIRSNTNDNDKRYHQWGQSESGIFELVEKHSNAGDVILDPFCGGGTVGLAALALNRRFIGIDTEPANIEITRKRLAAWMLNQNAPTGVI